ncbi:hypothetical protein SEA_KABOCHA_45 [Gordonia phage Kabocha]|uniref:Uncharacterized protein n=2 Tax=Chidieberevirus TaxID=3044687 RepID=A0A649VLB6_9CAUD|nr:hypothetical protein PQD14_gp044 [Gordonia phage Chidiebere]YP_010675687.1 hypothetical protein PQD15_gp040 [Gordonia phage ChisanaKitsune]AZS07898.1 hypothetical protein PBI_GRAY_44 [Gordonia phage Gray]WAA19832.1 hypothetical protein SEA_KABOCHA_45 [Gordonia phage Kabocha]WAA20022.1 hypothetical protein SEA_HANEM_44 [Gordonia phage Hanem]WNM67064.1 hypothetical protein SEA_SCHOMBER_43 [Gordonia Phage Schomber]QGJ92935.1 hypothetical protein PBI_CHIDIEBERE_44 [Gordonia phage Chidiebere]
MKLVFNPSTQNSVVYNDEGQMVAPGEWAYLDDEVREIQKLISDGTLVEVPVPDTMPGHVAPGAAQALQAAIDDQPKAVEDVAEKREDDDPQPVRNTGRRTPKAQNKKEA